MPSITKTDMENILKGLGLTEDKVREALREELGGELRPGFRRKCRAIAELVKQEFIHAWSAYKQYAWGHDNLKPLGRTFSDDTSSPLGGGVISAIDTLYLMELDSEVSNAVSWVVDNVSFNVDTKISLHLAVIRYIGGLISAYLITGNEKLLELAVDLGNRLLPMFENSPTGIPYNYVNLKTGEVSGTTVIASHVFSSFVNLAVLSKLTGDWSYYSRAKTAFDAIYDRRSALGLLGFSIDVETGSWVDKRTMHNTLVLLGEATLKIYHLLGDWDVNEKALVIIRSTLKHTLEYYNGHLWLKVVDMDTGDLVERAVETFWLNIPYILALAGRVSEAIELSRSYLASLRWGLHSGRFDYGTMTPKWKVYYLFPELIENYFHMYYLTGDDYWRMANYMIFQSLVRYCKYVVGYTSLRDVTTKEREDYMPAYFLSETMKYLYLTFADTPRYRYSPAFNTEGHPFEGVIPT